MKRVIVPMVESYNVNEEFLYNKTYLFIKGYAEGRKLRNTLKALPLARKMHNGQYRKGLTEVELAKRSVDENGNLVVETTKAKVHLPYLCHVLEVCNTLMPLDIPMSNEELDILFTCAILHDTLEDCDDYFPKDGEEYVTEYGFPPIVKETIQLLSKHEGSDEYELNAYFNAIKKNKFALLVKMADRAHNVKDIQNMKNPAKYIKETRDFFLTHNNSIAAYGKQNYPEISNALVSLKTMIQNLTDCADYYENRDADKVIQELKAEVRTLKKELTNYKVVNKGERKENVCK